MGLRNGRRFGMQQLVCALDMVSFKRKKICILKTFFLSSSFCFLAYLSSKICLNLFCDWEFKFVNFLLFDLFEENKKILITFA